MDLHRLADPFSPEDLEWRILQGGLKDGKPWGKCVAYITSRAVQTRFDEVCGPENWSNRFAAGPDGGVACCISIRIVRDDGSADWVAKWDGAENTDIEGTKGGLSGAMKRAAVQWSVGRYLYNLDEGWANFEEGGPLSAKIEGKYYRWSPPRLPAWAAPKPVTKRSPAPPASARQREAVVRLGGKGPYKDAALVDVPDAELIAARDALSGLQSMGTLKPEHSVLLSAIQTVLADRDRAAATG